MNKITYSDRDLVRLLVPILADQFLAILVGLADSLMSAAVSNKALAVPVPPEVKNALRARMLKSMLLALGNKQYG